MPTKKQNKEQIMEQDLLKEVKGKEDSCNLQPYHMQWFLNISYFAGNQWVAIDRVNNKLFTPPKEPWHVRFTANKIQPIVRTELAKVTRNNPVMTVTPATNEDSDIKAARTAEKVAEWLEYELGLQNNDQEMILWGLTCSMGFVKPFWNPQKGERIIDFETGQELKQGDADIDVVCPFEMKFDPTAKKWEEVKWVIQEKVRDVDYVKKMYGKEVTPENDIETANIYEAQLLNMNSLTSGITYKKAENSVKVKEYWEMPTADYPNGRRITYTDSTVLYYDEDIGFGEEDNTDRELPFFPFFNIKVPGKVVPTSVVEQLIPVQREYNKSRSQIIENKNLISNPIWLVPKNSGIDDISNEPGGIYYYKPGMKPEMVQPASVGSDVYNNIEKCDAEFEFISGQHETSHGQTPTGVSSGVAIRFLQEQDDTKLGPTIENYITCKQKYMSYLLKMIKYHYDIPRTIKLVGDNHKIECLEFKGSDLTSTDIRVQRASLFDMSKTAKQDWVIQLVEKGILNPQQDRDLIMRMLELGITDDLYDDFTFDKNHAQQEQERWKKGDFSPIVREFYDHDIHIAEHNKFRKTDEYEELPDEIKQLIDEHVHQHEDFFIQQTMPIEAEQEAPIQ